MGDKFMSIIHPTVTISKWARIGDGAVIETCALVTKDVPPNMMVKGMPAKHYEIDEKNIRE